MVVQTPFGLPARVVEGSTFFPLRESFLEPIGEEDVLSDFDCGLNQLHYPTKPKSSRAFEKQKGYSTHGYRSRRRSKAKSDVFEYAPATKELLRELENASTPKDDSRGLTPNLQGLLQELESALLLSALAAPMQTVPVDAENEEPIAASLKIGIARAMSCPSDACEAEPALPRKGSSKQSVMELGNVGYIRLRYPTPKPAGYDPNAPEELTLTAGARVHLQPHVDISAEKQSALEGHLSYAVEPPLPEGLTLHEGSGLISGVPQESQRGGASIHNICISIDATSKGGYPLGKLPLTSCPIVVNIVNARDKKRKRASKPL
jgi:hypothetical protein|mmetsp:Transcript_73806/g.116894  ORF Transcript_73806/g.116894 Transcript_73806/m.116894 type:complete len:319 (+) Transcript_73806:59-1015(+)